jgi:hypothetical protein
MVLIICFSPLKAKEMDRKVVKNKRLVEVNVAAKLEAPGSVVGRGGFREFALRQV